MGTAALPVGLVYGDCSSPQQRLDVSAKSRGHNAGLLWVHIDALPLTPALLTRIARAAPVLLLSGGFPCSRSARSRLIQGARRTSGAAGCSSCPCSQLDVVPSSQDGSGMGKPQRTLQGWEEWLSKCLTWQISQVVRAVNWA